jgi:steroid delta-isomerase-like uncharacterized protein
MDRNAQLRQLSDAWNAAWNTKDADKLAAFFAPGATYYEPDLPGVTDGDKGIREAAQKTWSDWPEATFELVSMTVEEPRVVVEWRSTATHRSGKVLRLEGIDVLEWDGDKIKSARVYYDVHARKLALGA